MAVGPSPSPRWLAASIRQLQKQVLVLASETQTKDRSDPRRLCLNDLVPFSNLPPGLHHPVSETITGGKKYEYDDVVTHAIDADAFDFIPHQFIDRENNGEQYAHGDVEIHAIDVDTSEVSLRQLIAHDVDGEKYEYGQVETHAIDVDTSDVSPFQLITSDDDGEQHEYGDAETQTTEADISNVAPALDPSHVNVMIEIAKKMSEETMNACVTVVATKLLECMDEKMCVFERKIKELEEDAAMTRHIQHATFVRKFGADY